MSKPFMDFDLDKIIYAMIVTDEEVDIIGYIDHIGEFK